MTAPKRTLRLWAMEHAGTCVAIAGLFLALGTGLGTVTKGLWDRASEHTTEHALAKRQTEALLAAAAAAPEIHASLARSITELSNAVVEIKASQEAATEWQRQSAESDAQKIDIQTRMLEALTQDRGRR